MGDNAELFGRVRESAQAITRLINGGINAPIEEYVDAPTLVGLCDSLSLEPEEWKPEDLERILIIRDGLYALRNKLRDDGDDSEYSVEQLLSGMDRLYADLERALRAYNQQELSRAQEELGALQRGSHVPTSIAPGTIAEIQEQAAQVLTQAHITNNHLHVNLLNFGEVKVNIDVLKNARLVVKRLSASVVAIRLSLEQRVLFQGMFKFLSEGADKVLNDLKELVSGLQQRYQSTLDFVSDLATLAEKGGRFTKLVSDFLKKVFTDPELTVERQIRLKVQSNFQSHAMLAASATGHNTIMLGGRRGEVVVFDPGLGRIVDSYRATSDTVTSITRYDSGYMALGTIDGVEVIASTSREQTGLVGGYRERVSAVAVLDGDLYSGARDGIVRRWTLAGGLSQWSREAFARLGRGIQRILPWNGRLLVACDETLVILSGELEEVRRIDLQFRISDMALMDSDALVVCGHGSLTHVNLARGEYSRILTASSGAKYSCVAALGHGMFCVGDEDGKVSAFDFQSGEELGSLKLDFELRGLFPLRNRILAFGGPWQIKSKSIALVIWEEVTLESESSA